MEKETKNQYFTRNHRLDYGPFYGALKTHASVDNFMEAFHSVGCGDMTRFEGGANYELCFKIYKFWRERGFLTRKQINLVNRLLRGFL